MFHRFIISLLVGSLLVVTGCNSDSGDDSATFLKTDADGLTTMEQTPYWAQTAWVSIHRDSRNSDYTPFIAPGDIQVKWEALEGAAILIAPAIGPEGNVYVTTGQGPGYSSLHTFDRDGNILWKSEPVPTLESLEDPKPSLESHAVSSGVMIDKDGYVYISDQNQFWSFTADGRVRWVTDISALGATSGFISSMITNEGYVGGISLNGLVMLFNRNDGSLVMPVLALPGGDGPERDMNTPGVWSGGLMDPTIIVDTMDWFLGFKAEICNTPAIHPETGRIYINGAGRTPEEGVLYGIDINGQTLEVAFEVTLGNGSGTSPTISPDGKNVYMVSGDGTLLAIDSETGVINWGVAGAGAAASPAVGPDGAIYSGSLFNEFDNGPGFILAVNSDGSEKWKVMCDDLMTPTDLLPTLPPFTPEINGTIVPLIPNGTPRARTNSIVTVTAKKMIIALAVGYDFVNPYSGRLSPLVHKVFLVTLDPNDGKLLNSIEVRDTNEANIAINSDGSCYFVSGSIFSSIGYYGLNGSVPEAYKAPRPPVGGVVALEPVSFMDLVTEGIDWVRELNVEALATLNSDKALANTALRRGLSQLEATADSILDAESRGEITAIQAKNTRQIVIFAKQLLVDAKTELDVENLTRAEALINQADTKLLDTLSIF